VIRRVSEENDKTIAVVNVTWHVLGSGSVRGSVMVAEVASARRDSVVPASWWLRTAAA
jgi:hypothetical protein